MAVALISVEFVVSQEPRPARQTKSARLPTATQSACLPSGRADQSQCFHTGSPGSATGASVPALKRSLTEVPKDGARPAWQDGKPAKTEDRCVRIISPDTVTTPSLKIDDFGSSKKEVDEKVDGNPQQE